MNRLKILLILSIILALVPVPTIAEEVPLDSSLSATPEEELLDPTLPIAAEEEPLSPPTTPTHPVISAVNPGHTANSIQNIDDFIELYNPTGTPIPIAGYQIKSKSNIIYTFPEGAIMNAEYLLLRYSTAAPPPTDADATYSKTSLGVSDGKVELLSPTNEILDTVCWGDTPCYPKFTTKVTAYPTLARCIIDGLLEKCSNSQDFEQNPNYIPNYDPENPGLIILPPAESSEPPDLLPQCLGLTFTEIYTYFETDYAEQFIELHNPTDEIIPLTGCHISYKSNLYPLTGDLMPDTYLSFQDPTLKLTKNPTTSNEIYLIDITGETIAALTYPHGQKKSTAYAFLGLDAQGAEIWSQTYLPTPAAPNIYQEFRTCPTGKIINPSTGNCITYFEPEPLPDCGEGKFRNPETNRCKSYASLATITTPCQDGYYRNPETNRCKKIATTATTLEPCEEGYERNPETNRCRKIRENTGTDYALTPTTYSDKSTFLAYGALSAVITTGFLYLIFQFRHELLSLPKKLFSHLKTK